jgi:hypothetical protein
VPTITLFILIESISQTVEIPKSGIHRIRTGIRAFPPRSRYGFCGLHCLSMLHGWDNFFMMAGTAAATLVGLLFVAITLGANSSTPRGVYGTRTFLTPTLLHFGAVLFQCLVVLAPWPSAWPLGIILGLCGSTGFACQIYVILMQRRLDFASPDWIDWVLFAAVPVLSHATLIAGAAGLIARRSFAPCAIAGATTLLLLVGIRGAWILTLWIAGNRDKIKT